MFLDDIDERYPQRVLRSMQTQYAGFQLVFDLPKGHSLSVTLSICPAQKALLEIRESAQEGSAGKVHFTYTPPEQLLIPATEKTTRTLLQEFFRKALGDREKHTYEGDLSAELIECFLLLKEKEI